MENSINLKKYKDNYEIKVKKLGRVSRIVGLTIESIGPDAPVGSLCEIRVGIHGDGIPAEIVGFKDNNILLMPLGSIEGIKPGAVVIALGHSIEVKVSDNLLGRVLNGLGEPMDDNGDIKDFEFKSIKNTAPDPLSRARIEEPLTMGVKIIDGLLTLGKGQRVGIFAGSGVGKSTLMGMIARNTEAEINVIALIGERGREVREFIERDLGEEGMKRSVVIIATSDQPALIRLKAAEVATTVAEYFRDQGKNVMLMMDSLTRYAMAQREVGLAVGEPPVSRGYTPSVFSMLPKLLERAGANDKGTITGLYTVLVDGDDLTEPVTDTARGILDGHIVLSRKIANRNQYPAIDVLASVSRVMSEIVTKEHKSNSGKVKSIMATYQDAEDLINVGAYAKGSSVEIDDAILKYPKVKEFLSQQTDTNVSFQETLDMLDEIVKGE